ncbi:MAG: response regulator [Bacteroidetes bacterium]|nr:response regulator [Bacteroidota bacterium]
MNNTAEVMGNNVFPINPDGMKLQNRRPAAEFPQDEIKQNRTQSQYFQTLKMQSLGVFAGTLAHDFNNIFGSILVSSSLLEMSKVGTEKHTEIIKAINNAVGRGAELIGQILTFTGRSDIARKPLCVPGFINDFVPMLKQSLPANIKVQNAVEEKIPSISADAAKLQLALLNICNNARDAMTEGGTITIGVKSVERKDIQLLFPAARHDQYICISVSDTGTGIDENIKDLIFDPFYSTKGKGKGLGLSAVYGIVKAHNGFVDLESRPRYGSTFYIYLPVLAACKNNYDSVKEEKSDDLSGTETILIIEDEKSLLDLARIMFELKGYKVITAEDGAEAVELYKQNRDKISVVFTDIGLPTLNGREVFEQLKQIDPDVKVIFTSGIFVDIKAELLKNGAKDFIQKPYRQEDVLRKIREVLDVKRE